MQLYVRTLEPRDARPLEIVERKGRGHPDTLCDAIAEDVSVHYARYTREHFGRVLHHNVDKVLLCAGASRPALGGGEVIAPIEIVLAGRATAELEGARIPVHELAIEAARARLGRDVPELDLERHVRIESRIRPGSGELRALFARGAAEPLANDTSIGVGYAPLGELERVVLAVEPALTSDAARAAHPALGPDVKVMGARTERGIELTIGCAMIGRHLRSLDDYRASVERVRRIAIERAREITGRSVEVLVNAADDLARGELYLTVTGTSAEAGDDGEVGRGNRASGLITPGRPMTLEAAAGKNPVSHVGKLYGVLAMRIADAIVRELDGVASAECTLVSRIGRPVRDPWLVELALAAAASERSAVRVAAQRIVVRELGALDALRDAILEQRVQLY